MFSDDVVREITQAAAELGLEPALLLAVAEVESAGKAFATVKGRREPLISRSTSTILASECCRIKPTAAASRRILIEHSTAPSIGTA